VNRPKSLRSMSIARFHRRGTVVALVLIFASLLLGAFAAAPMAGASGPTLKLSKTSGPKGTVYSATYRYTPDEGAGCDIRAALEWDGITAGGGFSLLGGTGCRDTSKGLVVPYPPRGSVGKHRVCAVATNVFLPAGVSLPTRCVTFTVTGTKPKPASTPRPTRRPTPRPTTRPTARPTPTPSPTLAPTPSPSIASPSPTTVAAVSSASASRSPSTGLASSQLTNLDATPTSDGGLGWPLIAVGLAVSVGLLAVATIRSRRVR
jgi:hypothetical protein